MTDRAAAPPNTAYRWLVLAAATFAQATSSFAMLGVAALAGFLQRDFRLSGTETGLLITATYGAAVFSLLFVGDLLDRKSERLIIGVGGTIAFIALLPPPQQQFCRASVVPARRGLRLQRDPARRQQIGFRLVSRRPARPGDGHPASRLPLGGAVAAATLPAIAATSGWRIAFAAGAAATLAGALIFALVYRPPADGANPHQSARP